MTLVKWIRGPWCLKRWPHSLTGPKQGHWGPGGHTSQVPCFFSSLSPQGLSQCPEHGKCSVTRCGVKENKTIHQNIKLYIVRASPHAQLTSILMFTLWGSKGAGILLHAIFLVIVIILLLQRTELTGRSESFIFPGMRRAQSPAQVFNLRLPNPGFFLGHPEGEERCWIHQKQPYSSGEAFVFLSILYSLPPVSSSPPSLCKENCLPALRSRWPPAPALNIPTTPPAKKVGCTGKSPRLPD